MRLVVLASTGSTNDDAKALAKEGAAHGTAVVADAQTAGRGRGDHRWFSPPGENIYLSVVLRPDVAPSAVGPIALVVGLAVAGVVDEALGAPRARIKWPNDVVVGARKIAGVLVEGSVRGASVVSVVAGVGLNVATTAMPDAIAARATSLAIEGSSKLDRTILTASLVEAIVAHVDRYAREGLAAFAEDLAARDALLDRAVRIERREGAGAGIDATGALLVRGDDGSIERVLHGEVGGFYPA